MSEIILEKAVWVTSPDNLQKLDITDPESVDSYTSLTDLELDMGDCGWVKIGSATVTYSGFSGFRAAVPAMCKKVDEAIAKIEASTYQKIMDLRAQKSKLLALEAPSHD